ncbi:MAG: hypothetical protein CMP59_00565 [Flavobacteriales bacterium]|nr:hypothetical protein [Flavobacteriales bacterium]|tara:strand:+ start:291 stop:1133 length:843 start_codon:yes stop_codon:yes gene_type:complete
MDAYQLDVETLDSMFEEAVSQSAFNFNNNHLSMLLESDEGIIKVVTLNKKLAFLLTMLSGAGVNNYKNCLPVIISGESKVLNLKNESKVFFKAFSNGYLSGLKDFQNRFAKDDIFDANSRRRLKLEEAYNEHHKEVLYNLPLVLNLRSFHALGYSTGFVFEMQYFTDEYKTSNPFTKYSGLQLTKEEKALFAVYLEMANEIKFEEPGKKGANIKAFLNKYFPGQSQTKFTGAYNRLLKSENRIIPENKDRISRVAEALPSTKARVIAEKEHSLIESNRVS